MGANLAATVYAWIGQSFALFLLPRSVARSERLRAIAVWAPAALLLFFLQDPLILFALVFFLMLALAPLDLTERAAFFLVVAPCLPIYLQAPLPFPGINFLINLTHYKVAAIALLLPLLVVKNKKDPAFAFSIADASLLGYIVYTAFIVGDTLNATSGLRFLIDQTLILAFPYFALRFAIANLEDFDKCLRGFLIASILLAGITLVATAKQWDFYRLYELESIMKVPDFRDGLIRIGATANTHSLGYHLALCLLFLEYLKRRMHFGFIHLLGLRAVFLASIFVTGSRGAMVGLALAFSTYVICTIRSRAQRWTLYAIMIAGLVAGVTWLLVGDFSQIDPHGTFAYRQKLVTTSIDYILENPFFGDYNYLTSGKFDNLVQGQGIIDVTNLYLQVGLHYGLIGLVLFFSVILFSWFGLRKRSGVQNVPIPAVADTNLSRLSAFVIILIVVPILIIVSMVIIGFSNPHLPNDLFFSFIGLLLLALIVFLTAFSMPKVKTPPASSSGQYLDIIHARCVLAGGTVGWLCLVATTSDVGMTVHLGIMLAAFSRAISMLSMKDA